MFTCVLRRYVASTVLLVSTHTFLIVLKASGDRSVEIKELISGVTMHAVMWPEFGGRVPGSEVWSVCEPAAVACLILCLGGYMCIVLTGSLLSCNIIPHGSSKSILAIIILYMIYVAGKN